MKLKSEVICNALKKFTLVGDGFNKMHTHNAFDSGTALSAFEKKIKNYNTKKYKTRMYYPGCRDMLLFA